VMNELSLMRSELDGGSRSSGELDQARKGNRNSHRRPQHDDAGQVIPVDLSPATEEVMNILTGSKSA